MKLHEQLTSLITKYFTKYAGVTEIQLQEPVEDICAIDEKFGYHYITGRDPERIPFSEMPDYILFHILTDCAVDSRIIKIADGVGEEKKEVGCKYRIFEYSETFRVLVFCGDNFVEFIWKWSLPAEIIIESPQIEIMQEKFWNTLRMWPDFSKEFLIHTLDAHGFHYQQ